MLEDDQHYRFKNCSKNPGHPEYFQVSEFKITDLPNSYRDLQIYNLIMSIAALTVRLTTKRKRTCSVGTGFIREVNVKPNRGLCTCMDCKESHIQSKVYWSVFIRTAEHLFTDEQDVTSTQADLYYDDSSSKDNVYHLYGLGIKERQPEQDYCVLEFVAHDEDIINLLQKDIQKYVQQNELLREQYTSNKNRDPLVIIVSHPHGGYKQISFSLGSMVEPRQRVKRRRLSLLETEAQLTNVEVEVQYPDGEVSKKFIWQLDDMVKETKEWLLHEGGIQDDVKNLQLYSCTSDGRCTIMEDNVVIRKYLGALTEAAYIIFKPLKS